MNAACQCCLPGVFKKMNIGTCGYGYNFIISKATCEDAAGALGLADITAADNTGNKNPFGCYYKLSTEQLYWSLAGNTVDTDQDRVSVCELSAGIFTACIFTHLRE